MTVGGVLKVGLGLGIVILVVRRCAQGTAEDTVPSPRPTPKPPSRPRSSERRSDSSPSKGPRKMRDAIVAKAIALGTPDPDLQRDYVGEPESRWIDSVLGGQKAPGVWRWFEKGHGTTCMISRRPCSSRRAPRRNSSIVHGPGKPRTASRRRTTSSGMDGAHANRRGEAERSRELRAKPFDDRARGRLRPGARPCARRRSRD